MASKRQKKKQAKKRQEQVLLHQYSPKEIKQFDNVTRQAEQKRIQRNIDRRESRARSKEYFRELGFSDSFINQNKLFNRKVESYSKDEIRKLKNKAAAQRREAEKRTALEKAGYTNITTSDLRKSWEKLGFKYPGLVLPDDYVYTAEEHLYIGAAEIQRGFHREDLSGFTTAEVVEHINDRIREANDNPSGSGDMYCVFKYTDGSAEKCQYMANVFYQRGYNLNPDHMKLSSSRYMKLTVSNKWSRREFLELTYNVITQMENREVNHFISDMRDYCDRNGLPFMDDIN